jgi:hypothetical protein
VLGGGGVLSNVKGDLIEFSHRLPPVFAKGVFKDLSNNKLGIFD